VKAWGTALVKKRYISEKKHKTHFLEEGEMVCAEEEDGV
jgi:hypothetical protein